MYNEAMEKEDMPLKLGEHLEDLRRILLRALLGLLVGIILSFFIVEPVLELLAQPVGGLSNLQAIEVTETISVYMRVVLLCGLVIASPWIFYQLFQFVGTGLKQKERQTLLISIPFAVALFIGGVAFAYFITLPSAMDFFARFLDVTITLRIKSYIGFVTNLLFWVGCSFEIPLIVFLLARIEVLNARLLIKGWRIAIVAIAILAAIMTPTADPVNMIIFMLPLFGLYLISIGLAALASKNNTNGNIEENE